MEKLIYAGIGSRKTPTDVCELMSSLASQLRKLGWHLRSGHADGADKAFEAGAGAEAEIFLPWSGFDKTQAGGKFIVPDITANHERIAREHHPNWSACSQGAKLLHIRNVCQVLGADLKTPSRMVICWTPNGQRGGGTGQALRIADSFHVPIFDLALEQGTYDRLDQFVHQVTTPPTYA